MTVVAPERGGRGRRESTPRPSTSTSGAEDRRFAAQRLERARRRRAGRIRRWLIATCVLVGIVGIGVGAWGLAWRTDLLAIDEVRVEGIDGKLRQAVEDAALVPLGSPLIGLDATGIAERVEALEWVRRATVRSDWPHGVLIAIEPRQALAQEWSTSKLIDRDGTVFMMPGVDPTGLPAVRADDARRADALKALEYVPDRLLKRITMVTAATADDIRFSLENGAAVRWGSSEQGALKAEVLMALLQRRALVYDVSSPLTPTTRGERRGAR